MKKVCFLVLTIALLSISSISFGQLNKTDCQEIIESIDVSSYSWAGVELVEKRYRFDSKTISFTFKETYFIVRDADGKSVFIPYDKVETIRAMPADDKHVGTFMIRVIH